MSDKKKSKEEKIKKEENKENNDVVSAESIIAQTQAVILTDTGLNGTAGEELEKETEKKKKAKKKKEKKPLDRAAKKKRKKIIWFSILGAAVILFAVMKVFGGKDAGVFVATTGAVTGEIEQTISTSGTVTTEKTKSYFSDVDVRISEVSVEAGDAVNQAMS